MLVGEHSVSGSTQFIAADMHHFIQDMPVYRPSLFKALAKPPVYLTDRNFDLWLFGGD
jgi:hypothetical protein